MTFLPETIYKSRFLNRIDIEKCHRHTSKLEQNVN